VIINNIASAAEVVSDLGLFGSEFHLKTGSFEDVDGLLHVGRGILGTTLCCAGGRL